MSYAYDRFVAANPDFPAILTVSPDERSRGADILRDLALKLSRYGSLTPPQVTLARNIAERLAEQAKEQHIPAPEGKGIAITGEVVHTKFVDNAWGSTFKMLVKVTTPEGSWLVWSSVPTEIARDDLKGRTITFTAELTRGDREPHFAFAKRPRNAWIVVNPPAIDPAVQAEVARAERAALTRAPGLPVDYAEQGAVPAQDVDATGRKTKGRKTKVRVRRRKIA